MNTQNAFDQAMNLFAISSPTGYTANVTDWLLNQLTEMGFAPTRTRKCCVVCTLGGEGHPLTLAAHVDRLGGRGGRSPAGSWLDCGLFVNSN